MFAETQTNCIYVFLLSYKGAASSCLNYFPNEILMVICLKVQKCFRKYLKLQFKGHYLKINFVFVKPERDGKKTNLRTGKK